MFNLRPIVFFPTAIGLLVMIAISFSSAENFTTVVNGANAFLTKNLGWLYSGTGVALVLGVFFALFSKVGGVTIGGKGATRVFSPFKWFSVSLTTVIALGIVFWPVAEAVMHYSNPPMHAQVQAGTSAALTNAMATMFTHWLFVPYAIYGIISMTFALALYNLGMPFSIATLLRPFLGKYADGRGAEVIDFIGCFAVVMGMSATLVSVIMAISDGFNNVAGTPKNYTVYAIVAFGVMAMAIVSAWSGLQKGIQILARTNTILYFCGLGFLFVLGPTAFVLNLGVESFGVYLDEFFQRNLIQCAAWKDTWAGYWTVAWFGSWFAWAPITCLFLGRIAKGYTVRQFVFCNFLLPIFFSWFWFSVFGGTGMHFEMEYDGMMSKAMKNTSFESLVYFLFDQFPAAFLTKCLFIFVCLISYVTAANANLVTIGGLCTKGVSRDNPESALWLKVFWGAIIASIAWLGTSYMGLDAIRALFNISGIAGLIIAIGALISFTRVVPAAVRKALMAGELDPLAPPAPIVYEED